MCIGADEGCQVVPEPIAPIAIMFFSLDPTRMPISSPDITSNGPIFIELIPGMLPMPFIPAAPGEGLAAGIGMFICVCGAAEGEACGICMPGMFICVCGDAEGEACGICMPGIFICVWGDAEGEAGGICMPGIFDEGLDGIFIPGILSISFLFAGLFCTGAFLLRGPTLRRCIAGIFIPGIFIPGILSMSCFFASCLFFVT